MYRVFEIHKHARYTCVELCVSYPARRLWPHFLCKTVTTMAAPSTSDAGGSGSSVHPTDSSRGGQNQSSTLEPEFVAVILASTAGTRLFPLTSDADDDHDDEFDALPQEPDEDEEEERDDQKVIGGDEDVEMSGGSGSPEGTEDPTLPKHLLPVGGTTILRRLIDSVASAGFARCVVVVAASDNGLTARSLLSEGGAGLSSSSDNVFRLDLGMNVASAGAGKAKASSSRSGGKCNALEISIVELDADCGGSADAIRQLSTAGIFPHSSHLVVMPGDLVLGSSLGDGRALRLLADAHRRGQEAPMEPKTTESFAPPACTLLLSDVGEEDENGMPLKESSKAKKGGLCRDEEDIEFIGLSSSTALSPHQPSFPRRLVLKQSKVAVEEDEGTGSTPKLILPKGRFRNPGGPASMTIRTDLNDLHVYVLSPWVVRLLVVRKGLSSLQKEVLPLLISRQFRGVTAAFGSAALQGSSEGREALDSVLVTTPFVPAPGGRKSITTPGEEGEQQGGDANDEPRGSQLISPPFAVSAQVLDRNSSRLTLRCATIPAYLYGCREVVAEAAAAGAEVHKIVFPEGTQVNSKFQSILLSNATLGEKVTLKSSTVGKGVKLGGRCRLNNCVIMDGASVGDNCILQNSVLGAGCAIGENCNLNDCQIAPGAEVPSLTKEKGESFLN